MKNITPMTGIAAVFVRGFMEHYYAGNEKLFDCQEAGKQAVIDDGNKISDGYLSKLSRILVSEGVVGRRKVGRYYINVDSEHTDAFQEFLEKHEDWGLLTSGTAEDLRRKSLALDHLEAHGAIRGGGENLIPRPAFSKLMGMVADGELDIVFVHAGLPLGVKYKGETHRIQAYEE